MGTLVKGSEAVSSLLEFDTLNPSKIINAMDTLINHNDFLAQREKKSPAIHSSARTFEAYQQGTALAGKNNHSEQTFGQPC